MVPVRHRQLRIEGGHTSATPSFTDASNAPGPVTTDGAVWSPSVAHY